MVAREGVRPALLSEHRHFFEGLESPRIREGGLHDGDELGGAVLESQRAHEGKAQWGVHLGRMLPGEHRFGAG